MGFGRGRGLGLTCPLFGCSDLLDDQKLSLSSLAEVA
jgi:hypothetical protein